MTKLISNVIKISDAVGQLRKRMCCPRNTTYSLCYHGDLLLKCNNKKQIDLNECVIV